MKQLNIKKIIYFLSSVFFSFQLSACSSRSDADMQAELSDSLQAKAAGVNATVTDGVATLNGDCKGDSCASKAEAIAQNIKGITSVKNNVSMAPTSTDYTLRTQVQTIISKYNGVQADVTNGVVVLRGSIDRSQLQPLMSELNNLKPDKIDNQLAVQ